MRYIFQESLDSAADVLRYQLELAKEEKHSVQVSLGFQTPDRLIIVVANHVVIQKVILVGGFGQSPSLQSHLRNVIAMERNYIDQEIHFLTPRIS